MPIHPPEDALPFTALVPEDVSAPITLYDSSATLCITVIERSGVQLLPAEWDVPGVYMLL